MCKFSLRNLVGGELGDEVDGERDEEEGHDRRPPHRQAQRTEEAEEAGVRRLRRLVQDRDPQVLYSWPGTHNSGLFLKTCLVTENLVFIVQTDSAQKSWFSDWQYHIGRREVEHHLPVVVDRERRHNQVGPLWELCLRFSSYLRILSGSSIMPAIGQGVAVEEGKVPPRRPP